MKSRKAWGNFILGWLASEGYSPCNNCCAHNGWYFLCKMSATPIPPRRRWWQSQQWIKQIWHDQHTLEEVGFCRRISHDSLDASGQDYYVWIDAHQQIWHDRLVAVLMANFFMTNSVAEPWAIGAAICATTNWNCALGTQWLAAILQSVLVLRAVPLVLEVF